MTWEQKIQACQAIGQFSLNMRKPGDWYVNHNVERAEGELASGGCVSGAKTPEEAVNQHWDWLTDERFYIVTRYPKGAYRWNGFMWMPFSEGQEAAR